MELHRTSIAIVESKTLDDGQEEEDETENEIVAMDNNVSYWNFHHLVIINNKHLYRHE